MIQSIDPLLRFSIGQLAVAYPASNTSVNTGYIESVVGVIGTLNKVIIKGVWVILVQ